MEKKAKKRYVIYDESRIQYCYGGPDDVSRDYLGITYAYSSKQALQFYLRRTGKRMKNIIYERADTVYTQKYIAVEEE